MVNVNKVRRQEEAADSRITMPKRDHTCGDCPHLGPGHDVYDVRDKPGPCRYCDCKQFRPSNKHWKSKLKKLPSA